MRHMPRVSHARFFWFANPTFPSRRVVTPSGATIIPSALRTQNLASTYRKSSETSSRSATNCVGPEGKAYQAWFTRDGASFEPSTVFSTRQGGVWLPATAALDQYAAIGFTIEDDAGAKQPTQAPFAVMPLQAAARRP